MRKAIGTIKTINHFNNTYRVYLKNDGEYRFQNKGHYYLSVEVSRHRITEENAAYNGILDVYPLSMNVFQKTYDVEVN